MKESLTAWYGILVLAVVLAASCSKIERLSDYNEIKSFEIVSYTPSAMELSGAQIENDMIYIGIDFGEYLFPLQFRAKPVFDAGIDRIVGIDFSKELVLENPESELVFYVMASSGLSRPYVIRTRVAPLDKNFALSRFFTVKEKEPDMLISEEGVIASFTEDGERRDSLKIFTVDGSYPVSITPEFNIAEASKFGNVTGTDGNVRPFVNGTTPLLFSDVETAHQLEVISQSGLKNVWNIVVRHAPTVNGADGKSTPGQREGSDINPRTISATTQGNTSFAVDEIFVDNYIDNISLTIKKKEDEIIFPLEVQVQFDVLNGIQVLELDKTATIIFEDWDDVVTFYLLDTYACVSRQWQIGLKERLMSGNDVLEFAYDYTPFEIIIRRPLIGAQTRGPAIILDNTQTVIHPESGNIYLFMTAVNNVDRGLLGTGVDDWELVLDNLQVTASEGATFEPLPAFEWRGSGSWATPISFKVTAQNGAEKTWRVNIRDMRNYTPSGECELVGLTITRHTPNYADFDAFTPVTIDEGQRAVTLKLIEDQEIYPLKVWVQCEISPFARLTSQNGGNDPLIFENVDTEQTITITAEDGTTTSNWTVKLQPPSHGALADVETFRVTSISQGAQLGQISKNDETGAIRLRLNAATNFPLEVTYAMTVSGRATASIPLRGTFTFNSYKDTQSFTVVAENGTTRNWNVRLVYEPQLPNRNLDEWRNGEPVGWGTANSASSGGTTQVGGNPGSAAQLRTSSTLGLIASGSLFLGEFNRNNRPITDGMSDPISLTFFGLPFSASGKILGIQADVIYSPGNEFISGDNRELGSCVIELVKPKPGSENELLRYHGANANGVSHTLNNAEPVAHAKARIGNAPGTAWDDTDITVVSNTAWTTIQVLFDYPNGEMPDFTHLHVVFASSAQGDAFRGMQGSILKIDNIRILYAEEE